MTFTHMTVESIIQHKLLMAAASRHTNRQTLRVTSRDGIRSHTRHTYLITVRDDLERARRITIDTNLKTGVTNVVLERKTHNVAESLDNYYPETLAAVKDRLYTNRASVLSDDDLRLLVSEALNLESDPFPQKPNLVIYDGCLVLDLTLAQPAHVSDYLLGNGVSKGNVYGMSITSVSIVSPGVMCVSLKDKNKLTMYETDVAWAHRTTEHSAFEDLVLLFSVGHNNKPMFRIESHNHAAKQFNFF